SNCLRVPFVRAVFPDALFIHLLREGRDVVESSYRQWNSRPNWTYIARKALTFPHIEAFGYARYYAGYALRRSFRRAQAVKIDTWGPRYEGIDRDLADLDLLRVCALQWTKCVQKAATSLAQLTPDRAMTIHYEEFVQRPQEHLERIACFASIDPQPYANSPEVVSVTTSFVGKGRKNLNSDQLESIAPLMEDTLREWNYQ
ncbi:MAG TPA: sulfotransferase, partial [Anaerolineae bacterium]|nr:sulfotransferase [Anaerolineae bacterium]